ncbi:sensor histidine kinase [Anaerocolumna sp. MB42-C2]|uniref:sensor histidine kinase n=1 Tax=Anaerocolumna sp. MB42-C2 TaxID=3070997 RepID=UPI0027DECB4F|nr:GHKL domain-containing protein [Anaerocolumna sp. MB42-C2]WMJ85383.1 GHKL domain-containing protein [Anaerocolumna sp. MB42-C2]
MFREPVYNTIKNHLQTIEKLYQNSKFQEAEIYQTKLYEEINKSSTKIYTLNTALNIILNDKIETAGKYQIQISLKMDNDLKFMTDYDIVVVFGNLFDNAIEACSKLTQKEKYIELNIIKYNNYLNIINIINPLEIPAEKRLSNNHQGLGLINVKSIVEKYNGNMNIYTNHERFEVNIQLLSPQI